MTEYICDRVITCKEVCGRKAPHHCGVYCLKRAALNFCGDTDSKCIPVDQYNQKQRSQEVDEAINSSGVVRVMGVEEATEFTENVVKAVEQAHKDAQQ